ncbi:MAG: DUF4294 domain-containing protein [Bacteroidales bacterium]|nr:DUF4294 domain-containing protein [Bacteroidales bacterium]
MKKFLAHIVFVFMLCIFGSMPLAAQNSANRQDTQGGKVSAEQRNKADARQSDKADAALDAEVAAFAEKALAAATPENLFLLGYEIDENGDTVFVDKIKPARIFARVPKQKGKAWKKYYKLIYNFNKVYPYALVGRKMMAQVDSTLAAEPLKRSERERYIKSVEKELFRIFEKDIRKMTISQGMVLMRLVDRECGLTPYEIIQTYEGDFAAGFWQFIARLFDADLKIAYDPEGKDKEIEELVEIWDSGDWDAFYWSIFWESPTRTVISQQQLSTQVKKR